jgi:regulator of protease activity HflC (stomatin/prohibitin superfamily)
MSRSSVEDINVGLISKLIGIVVLVIFVITAFFSSFYTVESGTRKIVLSAGEATSVATEGVNFKIPFYQKVRDVNIKTHKVAQHGNAASKDLQIVSSTISVNYHYDSSKLIEIFKTTGFDIDESIIAPRIQETLKSVAAKYSAEGLITNREKAKTDIDAILKEDLGRYHLIVEDIQLTEFNFSEEFNNAIESKQTEVQKTLKADNILQRTKIEADSRIAQARGEAEAIRIQAQAIQSQGGAEYVSLKWIEKWDGVAPEFVAGDASDIMLSMKK